ncbi:DUF6632 domain-containing protein [uncultured Microbulbifer sp.]|uniref:DUF6632 domain-containing protein n=1 Tax=uncultured Microbulbifer sp. TaxID=348147 RepID=UPI00344FE0B5
MDDITRAKYLPFALKAIGLFWIFGTYPMMLWTHPPGWGWTSPYLEYQLFILSLYVTLGVFLVRASKSLLASFNLIWFAIFLCLVSATMLLILVISDRTGEANLTEVISIQYLIAGVLWYLMPRNVKKLQQ